MDSRPRSLWRRRSSRCSRWTLVWWVSCAAMVSDISASFSPSSRASCSRWMAAVTRDANSSWWRRASCSRCAAAVTSAAKSSWCRWASCSRWMAVVTREATSSCVARWASIRVASVACVAWWATVKGSSAARKGSASGVGRAGGGAGSAGGARAFRSCGGGAVVVWAGCAGARPSSAVWATSVVVAARAIVPAAARAAAARAPGAGAGAARGPAGALRGPRPGVLRSVVLGGRRWVPGGLGLRARGLRASGRHRRWGGTRRLGHRRRVREVDPDAAVGVREGLGGRHGRHRRVLGWAGGWQFEPVGGPRSGRGRAGLAGRAEGRDVGDEGDAAPKDSVPFAGVGVAHARLFTARSPSTLRSATTT
jgi:hypothetical protein